MYTCMCMNFMLDFLPKHRKRFTAEPALDFDRSQGPKMCQRGASFVCSLSWA